MQKAANFKTFNSLVGFFFRGVEGSFQASDDGFFLFDPSSNPMQ